MLITTDDNNQLAAIAVGNNFSTIGVIGLPKPPFIEKHHNYHHTYGTIENDYLVIEGQNEAVSTFAGNDYIISYATGDSMFILGDGDDTIETHGNNNYINLGHGDDYAFINYGDNTIIGGYGNDHIVASTGDNHLFFMLGSGNDIAVLSSQGTGLVLGGDGDDMIVAMKGNITVNGGHGDDKIYHQGGGFLKALGGLGRDEFILDMGREYSSSVKITDFVSGEDFIHLRRTGFYINNLSDNSTDIVDDIYCYYENGNTYMESEAYNFKLELIGQVDLKDSYMIEW